MNEIPDRLQTALRDRFFIERIVGRGSMATVYAARDLKHDRLVALKVLRPELAAVIGHERFVQEIRILARLSHPHLLPLYDSGSAGGFLFYVMPFVDGESLRDRLNREGRLPVDDALDTTRDVANGLSFAHRHGIIHRDIKPENVLLTGDAAVLADFGIARAVGSAGTRITEAGALLGTPDYMSPEQALAEGEVDGRADIYALGCVLYEMLTGQPPFAGGGLERVLERHINAPPPDVRAARPEISPGIADVITQALAKSPDDRYETAAAFAAALRTDRVSGAPGERTPRRRHRGALAVAAAVVAIAAFAGIWLTAGTGEGFVAGQTVQLTFDAGLELDPDISPDGSQVAYAGGPRGAMHVFVREIAGGRTRHLTEGIPGHHRTPKWSPEGSQIAFLTSRAGTHAVQVIPAAGGEARRVVEMVSPEAYGPEWSPDGRELAFVLDDTIFAQPLAGGGRRSVAVVPDPHSLAWGPDGRIAFVSGNPRFVFGTLVLGNIAPSAIWLVAPDGEPIRLTPGGSLNMSPVWTSDGRHLLFISDAGGTRDVYAVAVGRSGSAPDAPRRLTTGLNAHTVSIAPDDGRLAYSVFALHSNLWSIGVPDTGSISIADATPITRGSQTIEGMAVSPDGRRLAFDTDRNGNQDLYTMELPDGEPVQLTSDPSDDFMPSWSPDGTEIAFYSFRSGNRDLYVMSSDGGDVIGVTRHPAHDRYPDWSPDGNRLVFYSDRDGRPEVHIVERPGKGGIWGAPRRLTSDTGWAPRWSPTDERIAYLTSGGSIRIVSAAGGEPRVVLPTPAADMPRPWSVDWAPDGRTLYFMAFDEAGRASLWRVEASGRRPEPVVRFDVPSRQTNRNEFATDGRRFFVTIGETESDVWMMELLRGR